MRLGLECANCVRLVGEIVVRSPVQRARSRRDRDATLANLSGEIDALARCGARFGADATDEFF